VYDQVFHMFLPVYNLLIVIFKLWRIKWWGVWVGDLNIVSDTTKHDREKWENWAAQEIQKSKPWGSRCYNKRTFKL